MTEKFKIFLEKGDKTKSVKIDFGITKEEVKKLFKEGKFLCVKTKSEVNILKEYEEIINLSKFDSISIENDR